MNSKHAMAVVLVIAFVLCGCGSLTGPGQEYSFPRVAGTVLDANSRLPLAGASVTRGALQKNRLDSSSLRGAQLLLAQPGVTTDRAGRFQLASEKNFHLLFSHAGWSHGDIIIEHAGYEAFRTNIMKMPVNTNQMKGPPEVLAGEILLRPRVK